MSDFEIDLTEDNAAEKLMKATKRDIACDETSYVCSCGFNKYLTPNCNCEDCQKYPSPLQECPLCGTIFQTNGD